MKKTVVITGITLAVILLAMGCSNPTSGSGTPGGNLGTGPLTLKGTIREEVDPTMQNPNYSYPLKNANGTLTASTGGTAEISGGSFEIEVEEPTPTVSVSTALGAFFSAWANVEDDNGSAKVDWLDLTTSGAIGTGEISKKKIQISVSGGGYTGSLQTVFYFYVDADVTITGGEATDSGTVYKAFTLNFKEGWNAVFWKDSFTATSGTVTLSVSNPDLYWVFDD
ncbi:MAG: hypothetical protein LBK40_04810 [Spirochaetaceae bacterium]|jgi:hypothetical protein|nr:hypothetical protein [Spirochaetaceae bacterium]